MNDAPIPVELTNFVPEVNTSNSMPTWRLDTDRDNGTVEINTNVWSKSLIAIIVGIFAFMSLIIGIGLYFISYFPEDTKITTMLYVLFPFCGYSAGLIISGIFVAVTMKNAALWKKRCRFRFDQNTNELYFSREDKRYSAHDYSSVVIGVTNGYNLRDLSQYQYLNKELPRQQITSSSRNSVDVPERVTELFFLIQRNDGTWTRHLVAYDQNTKAIERAAVQLQEMLNCRLATRNMSSRECAITQLPGVTAEFGNDALTSRSMGKNKVAYVVTTVLVLSGLGIICYGLYSTYYGKASLTWPTCTGTVTKSECRLSGGRRSSYMLEITYSYTVSEQEYTGNRYAFGNPSFSTYSDAKDIVDEYPVHSEVTVYYSPDHPEASVLMPGVRSAAWGYLIFGAVFATFPLVVLLLIRRAFQQLDFSAPCDRSEPIITLP